MSILARAAVHAALGDPTRLGIVEDLALSDRSPTELARRFEMPTNLLAHHLDVLETVGLIERYRSEGDHRRRYVRLGRSPFEGIEARPFSCPRAVLFVCTRNSARSQLAAALWRQLVGARASSAGTHPADQTHPGAVAAARRAGLSLPALHPRSLDGVDLCGVQVVTVCDRAHEELSPGPSWWHWSVPDPVAAPHAQAFDQALARLRSRIQALAGEATGATP